MEQLLFLGLIVFGFLMGGALYKRFGSYVSFTNRCLLKVYEEISHRGDLWNPQACKKRILTDKKRNVIITLIIFVVVFLFFHSVFIFAFCAGYLFWLLLWQNKTGLTQSNIQKAIVVFMPYILPGQEENFSKALASAYTYLITGIRYVPQPNKQPGISPATHALRNETAVSISKEMWNTIFRLANTSSYAQNAFDSTVLWSVLLYSIKPDLEAHKLLTPIQDLFSITVGPMYDIPADDQSISNLVLLQKTVFDGLVSANYDVLQDDDTREIMALYKTMTQDPDDLSEVSVTDDDIEMLNHLFFEIDRHVNNVLQGSKKS